MFIMVSIEIISQLVHVLEPHVCISIVEVLSCDNLINENLSSFE